MKKVFWVTIVFGIIISMACEDRDDNLTGPNVRIQNSTDQNFSLVQVRSESDSLFYENIASGGFSDYLEFEVAYRQDVLTIDADSTQLRFTPDSLSEPLPLGLYTYQITISEEDGLQLTFKVD